MKTVSQGARGCLRRVKFLCVQQLRLLLTTAVKERNIQEKPLSGIIGDTTARVPIPDDGVINYYKAAVPRFLPVIQSADSCEKKFHPAFKRTPPNSFSKGFSSLVFANRDNASKTTKKSPKDELYHSL